MPDIEPFNSQEPLIATRSAQVESTAGLIPFLPKREVSAQVNVAAFVAYARDRLEVFGRELPFDSDSWDLSSFISIVGKGDKELRAVFSSWGSQPNDIASDDEAGPDEPTDGLAGESEMLEHARDASKLDFEQRSAVGRHRGATAPGAAESKPSVMPEPFCAFAKACFRYQHGLRPTKVIGFRLAALRAACAALGERDTSTPWHVNGDVLNRASQLIKDHFSKGAAYRVGLQLQMFADLMDSNRLTATPLSWRSPIQRPPSTLGRVGEEFQLHREALLPSDFELDSLARAYRASSAPVEIMVTSMAALLCCAPDRIGELTRLPQECIVQNKSESGVEVVGLRWWPEKGAEPMIKWTVPATNDLVKEAIGRIAKVSRAARAVAKWYEANPKSLYLPTHLEHMREQELWSLEDIGKGITVEPMPINSARQWCRLNKVELVSIKRGQSVAKFEDVQRAVIQLFPKRFPILDVETQLHFADALCIARRNEFHDVRPTYWGVIEAVDQAFVSTGLGNRSEHGLRSVFDRLNLFNPDGSPISIGTKQFRHYLNTLAQKGGLSELDIAKWSGRLDVGQNGTYNHVSDRDLQAKLGELRDASSATAVRAVTVAKVNIVRRATLEHLGIKSGHTTDLGFCEHDFASSPCQLFRDCNNCNEQTCVKGWTDVKSVRSQVEDTQYLLSQAEVADRNGEYGASHWVQHQRRALARLTSLLSILENPSVPDGAVIRLSYVRPPSRLDQAARARHKLGLDTDAEALGWQVTTVEGRV